MINLFDTASEAHEIKDELLKELESVISSGWYLLGQRLTNFEMAFGRYVGSKYSCGVHSGTDALTLSLKALGIGPGDEVITTPLTAVYTVYAIAETGAKPILSDIDPATLNLDPKLISSKITKKTKAIIPVHLHGFPADMPAFEEFGTKKIAIVEDVAQALGATIEGKMVGTYGKIGCYSFYPTKNLGAMGDGGMIVTDDESVSLEVKLLRQGGLTDRDNYLHERVSIHSRLDEIQSAILSVKLKHLSSWLAKRREVANYYSQKMASFPITLPPSTSGFESSYHLYCIRTREREELQAYLREKEIGSQVHYKTPVHLQPCFKNLGYRQGDFPEAEKAARELLSIPMHPYLEKYDQDEVIKTIGEYFEKA